MDGNGEKNLLWSEWELGSVAGRRVRSLLTTQLPSSHLPTPIIAHPAQEPVSFSRMGAFCEIVARWPRDLFLCSVLPAHRAHSPPIQLTFFISFVGRLHWIQWAHCIRCDLYSIPVTSRQWPYSIPGDIHSANKTIGVQCLSGLGSPVL